MRRVRPPAGPIDYARLALSPEEGFVLSRVDAPTTTRELVALTGLPEERIEAIVDKLAELGVVGADPGASQLPPAVTPSASTPSYAPATVSTPSHAPAEGLEDDPAIAGLENAETEDSLLEDSTEAPETETVEAGEDDRNYRRIYETRFREMPTDQRVQLALHADGSDLLALCLDPDPRVIHSILQNPLGSVEHARYIALWHRSGQGLEHVGREASVLRDPLVSRRLLRNPQTSDTLLQKLLSPRRLGEIYKSCVDREVLERTRIKARNVLRQKWSTAQPEERVELLLATEARCLVLLTNCTIDGRSVQILCGRTAFTTMFVASMARFSAAPPALLGHMAKLPLVKRNPQLKKMLMAHKNLPGDVKRSM